MEKSGAVVVLSVERSGDPRGTARAVVGTLAHAGESDASAADDRRKRVRALAPLVTAGRRPRR